jgi:hypothetical protein
VRLSQSLALFTSMRTLTHSHARKHAYTHMYMYAGLPNPREGGRERAIAYVTCSTGGTFWCFARAHARTHAHTHTRTHRAARTHGTRSHTHSHTYTGCMDTYNFPPWSIENADAERITRFPYFHEQAGPGRIQDNLDYFTQIEGDDAFWPSQA